MKEEKQLKDFACKLPEAAKGLAKELDKISVSIKNLLKVKPNFKHQSKFFK
ncbi:hypothetical protein [Polaribacter sp.]|uniref:hypothetical protein n=1 Tax=Polaribacter sp. TaxID=1920175 RepID=UPI003F6CEE19